LARATPRPGGGIVGAIPFAQLGARSRRIDLREVGNGTVSGTGLYRVGGFRALAAYGILEVAKGAVGPALAARVARPRRSTGDGRRGPLAIVAGAAAVVGHNWSPFLRGAGGRGVSPAIGALMVTAPAGSALLLAGLGLGKLAGETAIGCAVADVALVPTLAKVGGRAQAAAGAAVLVPIVAKRIVGNGPPATPDPAVYVRRLVVDRDTWAAA
jgi:glycerol-3-phosphate acyltransferase PlsY